MQSHVVNQQNMWLQIMTEAAEKERPVLTYCRLGKDRTGIMTTLVLSTCGASEDEIVSDYARCNNGSFEPNHCLHSTNPGQALCAE